MVPNQGRRNGRIIFGRRLSRCKRRNKYMMSDYEKSMKKGTLDSLIKEMDSQDAGRFKGPDPDNDGDTHIGDLAMGAGNDSQMKQLDELEAGDKAKQPMAVVQESKTMPLDQAKQEVMSKLDSGLTDEQKKKKGQ